jgi:TetR/AcrR family transcriptional regulator, cholesterol catabolism regulator
MSAPLDLPARRRPGRGPAHADPAESERVPNARDTILEVAAELFSNKGFAESGLREIADTAGIRASTVYYYFPSKERIYEEIIRIAVDRTLAAVQEEFSSLPAGATPRMRVEAAIRGHLLALHANRPYTSTNAQSRMKLPEAVNEVIRPVRERYSDFWRDLLQEAWTTGWLKRELDPAMVRPLILGTLNRTVGWYDTGRAPIDRLVGTTLTTFSGIWAEPPVAHPPRNQKRSR